MPVVSVIVPAYNAERYIKKTIESILAQTFTDFECIVIDDGSTDGTVSVVEEFKDNRIKIIKQENSGGPAKPRNVGIAAAVGEFVCIFDSDDIMQPHKLAEYVTAFKNNEKIDFIFSDFSLIDESDRCINPSFLEGYSSFKKHMYQIDNNLYEINMDFFFSEIIKANFIGTSSVLFRRGLVGVDNIFDEGVSSGDDKFAWIVLAKKSKFAFLNMILHSYRKREGSISTKNIEKLLINKIYILEKIEEYLGPGRHLIDIRNKKNEYYFSLAYIYRKSYRFKESKNSYCSIKGTKDKLIAVFNIVKLVAEYFLFFLKLKFF